MLKRIAETATWLDSRGREIEADVLTDSLRLVVAQIFTEQDENDEVPDAIPAHRTKLITRGRPVREEDHGFGSLKDPSKFTVIDPRDPAYLEQLRETYHSRPRESEGPNAYEWLQQEVLPRFNSNKPLPNPQFVGDIMTIVPPGMGHLTSRDRARMVIHDDDLERNRQGVMDVFGRGTRYDQEGGRSKGSAYFNILPYSSEGKPVEPVDVVHDSYLDRMGVYDTAKQRGALPVSRADLYNAIREHRPEILEREAPRAFKDYQSIDWTNPDPAMVKKLFTQTSRMYNPDTVFEIERRQRDREGRPNPYINRNLLRSFMG